MNYGLRVYVSKNCWTKLGDIVLRGQVDDNRKTCVYEVARNNLDHCTRTHRNFRMDLDGALIEDVSGTPIDHASEPVDLPGRLIVLSGDMGRVRRTTGWHGKCVTPSYCWGNTRAVDFTLKAHNVAELEQEQELNELVPKMYRDAMHLTQSLGIQYLWIDALCIIQDDDAGWMEEARKMASIYGKATVTTAAVASMDTNDGLFDRATSPLAVAVISWLERGDLGTMKLYRLVKSIEY